MMSCNGCKYRNTLECITCVGWDKHEGVNTRFNPKVDINKEMAMLTKAGLNGLFGVQKPDMRIEKVIFNAPATVVIWKDRSKTVVKSGVYDVYDPEKGLAIAIAKKALGNQGNYYEVFKKWLPEEDYFDPPCPIDTTFAGDFDGDTVTEHIDDSFIWAVDISEDGRESSIFVHRDKITLLTPIQLGRLLHISVTEIRERCRDGHYSEAKKVNGKWQIPCVIKKIPEWL